MPANVVFLALFLNLAGNLLAVDIVLNEQRHLQELTIVENVQVSDNGEIRALSFDEAREIYESIVNEYKKIQVSILRHIFNSSEPDIDYDITHLEESPPAFTLYSNETPYDIVKLCLGVELLKLLLQNPEETKRSEKIKTILDFMNKTNKTRNYERSRYETLEVYLDHNLRIAEGLHKSTSVQKNINTSKDALLAGKLEEIILQFSTAFQENLFLKIVKKTFKLLKEKLKRPDGLKKLVISPEILDSISISDIFKTLNDHFEQDNSLLSIFFKLIAGPPNKDDFKIMEEERNELSKYCSKHLNFHSDNLLLLPLPMNKISTKIDGNLSKYADMRSEILEGKDDVHYSETPFFMREVRKNDFNFVIHKLRVYLYYYRFLLVLNESWLTKNIEIENELINKFLGDRLFNNFIKTLKKKQKRLLIEPKDPPLILYSFIPKKKKNRRMEINKLITFINNECPDLIAPIMTNNLLFIDKKISNKDKDKAINELKKLLNKKGYDCDSPPITEPIKPLPKISLVDPNLKSSPKKISVEKKKTKKKKKPKEKNKNPEEKVQEKKLSLRRKKCETNEDNLNIKVISVKDNPIKLTENKKLKRTKSTIFKICPKDKNPIKLPGSKEKEKIETNTNKIQRTNSTIFEHFSKKDLKEENAIDDEIKKTEALTEVTYLSWADVVKGNIQQTKKETDELSSEPKILQEKKITGLVRPFSKDWKITRRNRQINTVKKLQRQLLDLAWQTIVDSHQFLLALKGRKIDLSKKKIEEYNSRYILAFNLIGESTEKQFLRETIKESEKTINISGDLKDLFPWIDEQNTSLDKIEFLKKTNSSRFLVPVNTQMELNQRDEQIFSYAKSIKESIAFEQEMDPEYWGYNPFFTKNKIEDEDLAELTGRLMHELEFFYKIKAGLWVLQKHTAFIYLALFGKIETSKESWRAIQEGIFCISDSNIQQYNLFFAQFMKDLN